MCTQASSTSDAAGYSSWSMWFLRIVSWMSCSACGSIHVVTNDARLSVSRPSSMSPVCSSSYASSGSRPCAGKVPRSTWSRKLARPWMGP